MNVTDSNTMRIAVTYEEGEIFQHFGQTRLFKFYDIVNGDIAHSEVRGTDGVTHCSLGSWLYENGVNVLICGGLGAGASKALLSAGILVYAGNCGDCDDAVYKLLRKELIYNPCANCHESHHHHDGGGCHHHQEEAAENHNHYEGGHNHKDTENAGHDHRIGYDR